MSRHATQLYLLRHADAGNPMSWHASDSARPLSPRGNEQAARLGDLLARTGFRPDAILTSPRLRAEQTAAIVAGALGLKTRVVEELGGPLELDGVERILATTGSPGSVVLVGHDPDFSDIASDLTGTDIAMKKGALVRIDVERPLRPRGGSLRWLVPPDLLAGDGQPD
jgi:phosphohistidine phosphatase